MEEGEVSAGTSGFLNEQCDSSDSDHDSLQIAIENETTPKKKTRASLEFDGRFLDKTIEETMKKCENFTPEIAKKMLLKLIKNEHILALSVLKAEEEDKKERERKSSDSEDDGDDDKRSESDAPATPKLTRLKAKQLNKKLPFPGSLKTPEPCEEVVALIQDELKSDDEDDEYQPGDEDIGSDEDIANTTFSDIESQPSTPGSALLHNEQDVESPEKDGEFKVPRVRSLSVSIQEAFWLQLIKKICILGRARRHISANSIQTLSHHNSD